MVEVEQTQKKGSYYIIRLSDSHTTRLLEPIVFQYNVFPGKHFSEKKWQKILNESTYAACYKKLLRLLSIKAWSERDVQNRLKRHGFSNTAIVNAMTRAKRLHLIDDVQFVKAYLDQERSIGRFGLKRIVANLQKRGIASDLIREIMAEEGIAQTDHDPDFRNALRLGERKWQHLTRERNMSCTSVEAKSAYPEGRVSRLKEIDVKPAASNNKKMRLLRYLAGRGFSSEVCFKVAERLTECNSQ